MGNGGNGYVKLYRKILDNEIICKSPDHIAVWMYLLLTATHKPYKTRFEGKDIILQPGQLVTGTKKIADHFGMKWTRVRYVLDDFEKCKQIAMQKKPHGRLITIVSWNLYNGNRKQIATKQEEEQEVLIERDKGNADFNRVA